MSRRPSSTSRHFADGGSIPYVGSLHPKSRPSPLLSLGLVVVGAFLIIGYLYSGSGGSNSDKEALMKLEGYPGQRKAKVPVLSKFGRPAKLRSSSWWIRYFVQTSLEENEAATKKFEQAAAKRSYTPACQIFHLKSHK